MGKSRARALGGRSVEVLRALGGVIPDGEFVCPICLYRRPLSKATVAHFPAEKVAGINATTLACESCNSLMGGTYEPEGVDLLGNVWQVSAGPHDGGAIAGRATVTNSGGGIRIELNPGEKRNARSAARLAANLAEMRQRSSRPHEMQFTLVEPNDETGRRTLLAWSYLLWAEYAGFGYTASVGATRVRELILEPDRPLPDGVFFRFGPLKPPLPEPQPVLLVRASGPSREDVEEFLGLGVAWGAAISVLPFANDAAGRCWQRILELHAEDSMSSVRRIMLRSFSSDGRFARSIERNVVISHRGRDHIVTDELAGDGLELLAAGMSSRRVDPRRGSWVGARAAARRRDNA